MDTFIARQAILDRSGKLAGYELLYRSSGGSGGFDGTDGDVATSRVVSNCVFSIGLENLVGKVPAFINFPRNLLVNGIASVFTPDSIVVEVLETVEPDSEVLNACRDLKRRGFRIALDDFVYQPSLEPLVTLADIIKVDFRLSDETAQLDILRRAAPKGIKLLAEKVETADEFQRAVKQGYTYFQGHFFARPDLMKGKTGGGMSPHYYELLAACSASPFDYEQLEGLIRRDPNFAYKLLQYLNSARFSWASRITSIRHALMLLGEEELRKWISLVVAYDMSSKKPQSLVALATVRAQFCEQLGKISVPGSDQTECFLMGLFSLLDAMMDQPLEGILSRVSLSDEVRAALLGRSQDENYLASLYRLMLAYERGEWEEVHSRAEALRVRADEIPVAYQEAVAWTERAGIQAR